MNITAPSIRRPVSRVLALVALGSVLALAVHGSEPTEPSWPAARSTTVLDAKHPENPQIHIAINHVLQQSRTPLLQVPAKMVATKQVADEVSAKDPNDQQSKDVPADEPLIVFGSYGTSADGWRPAHLPVRTSNDTSDSTTAVGTTPAARGERTFRAASSSTSPAEAKPTEQAKPVAEAASAPKPSAKPDSKPKSDESIVDVKPETKRSEPAAESKAPPHDEQTSVVESPPTPPLPPLTQNMKNLRAKVRRVIKSYYTRPLNSRENDPWELMHGMLAYGVQSQIRQGGPQGKTITLVGWLCYNKPCKGFTLLYLTPEDKLRAKQGVGLQGHMGQFLAMLAQCQVSPDYPIRVGNEEFTINDLIKAEQETCYTKTELTFKLIALMHYLDTDATWVNDQGQSWDIPRLIREELAQPIRGAACGGTHRLSGLSLAARTRVARGEPLDGEYLRAAQFVEKYQNYAFQLQNRDGSLSTEWFRGRGDEDDIDRRVKTTGHILEWLCYSLQDQDVRSAKTFRAANYLATLLATNFNHEWELGPLGHAIHALRLYDERVFQPYDGQDEVAKKPVRKTARRPYSSSRSSSDMY
jgi:hypothetical protein